MLNKNIFTAAALILLGTSIQVKAQDITVAGTVKDVYGNPLPGVIVSANHKDLYITDKNGQYTAKVGKSEDLEFSLLGYKPTSVKASSQADVVLEDGHRLNLLRRDSVEDVMGERVIEDTVDDHTGDSAVESRESTNVHIQ